MLPPFVRKFWWVGLIFLGMGGLLVGFAWFALHLFTSFANHPTIEKKNAADILMSAWQAGDYPKTFEVLGPYDAGRHFEGKAARFQEWIETNGFQIQSWAWTRETSRRTHSSNIKNSNYVNVLEGTVVFADGTDGTIELTLSALGLQYNPWRFGEVRMKRTTPKT